MTLINNLNLRRLKVEELSQLIANLNYNFEQILSLPGFKGIQGDEGDSITGSTGTRGNIWVFVNGIDFINAYTELTSNAQITLTFINNELNTGQSKLYTTLGVTNLINTDALVLPNGVVIQLRTDLPDTDNAGQTLTPRFIDTGIAFGDQSGVSEDRVLEIVQNLFGSQLDQTSPFRKYQAIAKNYADNAPGLNVDINSNSVVDIKSSLSGQGPNVSNFEFLTLKESNTPNDTQPMTIVGHPNDYHRLIQNTQELHTNDFAPGVNDWAALALLQNSLNNGLLIGYGKSGEDSTTDSIRDFARLYRTDDAFRITSSYSPRSYNTGDYSEILMSNNEIDIMSLTKMVIKTREFDFRDCRFVLGKHFQLDDSINQVFVGLSRDETDRVNLYGNDIRLTNQQNYDFLTTDNEGIIRNLYTFYNTLQNSSSAVISGEAIANEIRSLNDRLILLINNLSDRIDNLDIGGVSGDAYTNQTIINSGNINIDSLDNNGTYVLNNLNNSLVVSNSPIPLGNNRRLVLLNFSYGQSNNSIKTVLQILVGRNIDILTSTQDSFDDGRHLYFRTGVIIGNNATPTFTAWAQMQNGNDIINIGDGLQKVTLGGTLEADATISDVTAGNIVIRHEPRAPRLQDNYGGDDTILSGIGLDTRGHISSVNTSDLNDLTFLKRNLFSEINTDDDRLTARTNLGVPEFNEFDPDNYYTVTDINRLLPGSDPRSRSTNNGFPDNWPTWLSNVESTNTDNSGVAYTDLNETLLRVVCSGKVNSDGTRADYWGPDRVDGFPFFSTRLRSGNYQIIHNLGDDIYGVVGTSFRSNLNLSTISSNINSCEISLSTGSTTSESGGFSFIIFKLN